MKFWIFIFFPSKVLSCSPLRSTRRTINISKQLNEYHPYCISKHWAAWTYGILLAFIACNFDTRVNTKCDNDGNEMFFLHIFLLVHVWAFEKKGIRHTDKNLKCAFLPFFEKKNFSPPSRDYSQMIGHVSGNIQQVRRVDNTSETCDFVFVIFCEREEKMSDELWLFWGLLEPHVIKIYTEKSKKAFCHVIYVLLNSLRFC